jgi:hypothetical protein
MITAALAVGIDGHFGPHLRRLVLARIGSADHDATPSGAAAQFSIVIGGHFMPQAGIQASVVMAARVPNYWTTGQASSCAQSAKLR